MQSGVRGRPARDRWQQHLGTRHEEKGDGVVSIKEVLLEKGDWSDQGGAAEFSLTLREEI